MSDCDESILDAGWQIHGGSLPFFFSGSPMASMTRLSSCESGSKLIVHPEISLISLDLRELRRAQDMRNRVFRGLDRMRTGWQVWRTAIGCEGWPMTHGGGGRVVVEDCRSLKMDASAVGA